MRTHKYVRAHIVYLSNNKYICAIYALLGVNHADKNNI